MDVLTKYWKPEHILTDYFTNHHFLNEITGTDSFDHCDVISFCDLDCVDCIENVGLCEFNDNIYTYRDMQYVLVNNRNRGVISFDLEQHDIAKSGRSEDYFGLDGKLVCLDLALDDEHRLTVEPVSGPNVIPNALYLGTRVFNRLTFYQFMTLPEGELDVPCDDVTTTSLKLYSSENSIIYNSIGVSSSEFAPFGADRKITLYSFLHKRLFNPEYLLFGQSLSPSSISGKSKNSRSIITTTTTETVLTQDQAKQLDVSEDTIFEITSTNPITDDEVSNKPPTTN